MSRSPDTAAPFTKHRQPDTSRIAAFGGVSVKISIWRGDNPALTPLVFLNGLAADTRSALSLLSRLADRPLLTIEMPGVGGAPEPMAAYTVADIVAITAKLATEAGYDRFDCAGFSWGGVIAQQLALDFAPRVRRLVLLATTPLTPAPGVGAAALFDADVMTSGLRLSGTSLLGLGAQLFAVSGWSAVTALPHLTDTPTLVLAGRNDAVVPISYARWLAQLIPGAELAEIDGAHLFAFRRADIVAPLIAAFLDKASI